MLTLTITKTATKYTITVTSSTILPKTVFLYRHDIDDVDIYQHICNIDEIEKYTTTTNPLFTKDVVEFTSTSITELEDILSELKAELIDFEEEYNKYLTIEDIGETTVINIGIPDD